jgi:IS30 family transposase
MVDLKKQRGLFTWSLGSSHQNAILNALSELTSSLIEDLTDYRRSIWRRLRTGQSQRHIARALRRHPQSVSQAIGRGHIKSILQGEHAIREALGAESKPASVYPKRSNRK